MSKAPPPSPEEIPVVQGVPVDSSRPNVPPMPGAPNPWKGMTERERRAKEQEEEDRKDADRERYGDKYDYDRRTFDEKHMSIIKEHMAI